MQTDDTVYKATACLPKREKRRDLKEFVVQGTQLHSQQAHTNEHEDVFIPVEILLS